MPAPPARRNLFRPQINFGGHCIKKFKRIPSRTLTERASPRSRTRAGNPKNFLVFFLRILPPPSAAKREKEWKGNFWAATTRYFEKQNFTCKKWAGFIEDTTFSIPNL